MKTDQSQFQLHTYGMGIFADYSDVVIAHPREERVVDVTADTHIAISGNLSLHIRVAPQAHVIITEEMTADDVCMADVILTVGEGAQVEYRSIQTLGAEISSFVRRSVHVQRNATCTVLDFQLGGARSLSYTTSHLEGEHASAYIKGVFFGDTKQLFDLNTESVHNASHTASDILVKGVLGGHAKGIYRGLVRIDPQARNCSGYQKEDTLLLSPSAEIDSVPNLEIENNEVSCSHGVTTSRINAEKLFYAVSRGIPYTQAVSLFVQGHFGEVLSAVSDASVREELAQLLESKLHTL